MYNRRELYVLPLHIRDKIHTYSYYNRESESFFLTSKIYSCDCNIVRFSSYNMETQFLLKLNFSISKSSILNFCISRTFLSQKSSGSYKLSSRTCYLLKDFIIVCPHTSQSSLASVPVLRSVPARPEKSPARVRLFL